MENLKKEALLFIERLQALYFEQRNVSALLPAMTEDTSWIGTGAQKLCRNLEQAQTALSLETQELNGHFTIIEANYNATCISEKVCIVYGEVTARPDNPAFADQNNRVTAVCVRTEEGMKLAYIHMSHPDADQEDGRFYITRDEAGHRETLRLRTEKTAHELLERNSQLEALTENIPGGVHQCECDEGLTFLSMSHSFLTLVGRIGGALFPQKSADYFVLYKCADAAHYRVKGRGKNNFAFYDPRDSDGTIPCGLSSSAVGGIDSDTEILSDAVGDKLAQYTFRMLYNSIDINTAVEHLLEIVGRAYDVSWVYIFESSADGRICSNTFEWRNTGVPPEIDKLHPDLYGILAQQGICSVLQCAIMDDGVFKGYVGFDECRENRAWTKPQIASLTLISNVLSTFLLKLRLKEGLPGYGEEGPK